MADRVEGDNLHTFDTGGNCIFTIDKRYKFNKVIGKGAYGTVVSCRDSITGKDVAIKKITRAFDDVTDSKRILREIMLLRHFRHENTIGLVDILVPKPPVASFEDVYMVLDLMETDLHRIIHSKQALTDEHVQYFIAQVLKALKYIHSAGVLHRDLKPSNLLVNSTCDLKVCDFGLARGVNDDDDVVLTEYVVTRWYRAPEVMLSSKSYTYGVDVWSTGCILGELLLRKPLFQGEDYIHQLNLINEFLGTPKEEDMDFITSEKARKYIKSLSPSEGVSFERMLPNANPLAIDLLRKMLAFDPTKRISVEEALNHPYLEEFAASDADLTVPSVAMFDFKHEQQALSAVTLRELIWREVCHFHPEAMDELEAHLASKQHLDPETIMAGEVVDPLSVSPRASALGDVPLISSTSSSSLASNNTSLGQVEAGEDLKRRRRPEDTITPMKLSRHEPSLFSSIATAEEKREQIDEERGSGESAL